MCTYTWDSSSKIIFKKSCHHCSKPTSFHTKEPTGWVKKKYFLLCSGERKLKYCMSAYVYTPEY